MSAKQHWVFEPLEIMTSLMTRTGKDPDNTFLLFCC